MASLKNKDFTYVSKLEINKNLAEQVAAAAKCFPKTKTLESLVNCGPMLKTLMEILDGKQFQLGLVSIPLDPNLFPEEQRRLIPIFLNLFRRTFKEDPTLFADVDDESRRYKYQLFWGFIWDRFTLSECCIPLGLDPRCKDCINNTNCKKPLKIVDMETYLKHKK